MKNLLLSLLVLIASISLHAADKSHAKQRNPYKSLKKKASKKSLSTSDIASFSKLDETNDDEIVDLSFDTSRDDVAQKHQEMFDRVEIARQLFATTNPKWEDLSHKITRLQTQIDGALLPPVSLEAGANKAKRLERAATLQQTKIVLPILLRDYKEQLTLMKEMMAIINSWCPEQK